VNRQMHGLGSMRLGCRPVPAVLEGPLSSTLLHMNRVAKSAIERSSTVLPRICLVVVANLMMGPAAHAAAAIATCVLPVPDDGDVTPSKANVEGRIVRVGHGFIEVAPRSGRPIHVSFMGKTGFYSAFGGDYDPSELAVGQHVAVWFVGRKPSVDGAGRAAYLQLYSKDPADQPHE